MSARKARRPRNMTAHDRATIDASFDYQRRTALLAEQVKAEVPVERNRWASASDRLQELDQRFGHFHPYGLADPIAAEPWLLCYAATLAWQFSLETTMTGKTYNQSGEKRRQAFRRVRAETIRTGLSNRFPGLTSATIDRHVQEFQILTNAEAVSLLGISGEEWLRFRWSQLCPRSHPAVKKVFADHRRHKRAAERRALGKPTVQERSDDSARRLADILDVTTATLYNWFKSGKFYEKLERHAAKRNFTLGITAEENSTMALSVKFFERQTERIEAGRASSPSGPTIQSASVSKKESTMRIHEERDPELQRLFERPDIAAMIEAGKRKQHLDLLKLARSRAPAIAEAEGLDPFDPDVIDAITSGFMQDYDQGQENVRLELLRVDADMKAAGVASDERFRRIKGFVSKGSSAAN